MGFQYGVPINRRRNGPASAPSAPTFISAATFNAPEGADYEHLLIASEPCVFFITGGADANQFQLTGDLLTFFTQAYVDADPNTHAVTIEAQSIATGLTAVQTLTATVTDVAAPVNTATPSVSGGSIEGDVLTATPGTWTGADSVEGQWYRGASTPITDATSLTYKRTSADIGATLKYRETAVGQGGSATQDSADAAATINGIVIRVAMRATDQTDESRWTQTLTADGATPISNRVPTDGAGPGAYSWDFDGSLAYADSGTGSPTYANGHVSITGGSGIFKVSVPIGVSLECRFMFGARSSGATTGFAIRDGASGGNGEFARIDATATIPSGSVCDHTGAAMTPANWNATAATLTLTSLNGEIRIFKGAGASLYLRAVEITYPGALAVTSGAGPYYVSASGDDTAAGTDSGTAWAHAPGDPAATGDVASFDVLPDGQVLFNKGDRHRPASYSGRITHLQPRLPGTSGHQITYGAYGTGANPVIDGSEVLASWSAVSSGDVSANPNYTNIVKSAVTGAVFQTPIFEGDKYLAPAQWPASSNPYDFGRSYPGSDAYKFVTNTEYTGIVAQGDPDSHSAGFKACTITHPDAFSHYGSVDLTGYMIVCFMFGARLNEYAIDSYNTSTGEIAFHIANNEYLHGSGPTDLPSYTPPGTPGASTVNSGYFCFAVRYHPFDIAQAGQCAYNAAKTTVFIHPFGSADRSISRMQSSMVVSKSYLTLDSLTLGNFGGTIGNALLGTLYTVSGLVLNDVKVRNGFNTNGNWMMYITEPFSNFAFTNIDIADCAKNGGLGFANASSGTIDGFRMRHEGRSSLYFGGSCSDIAVTDLDVSDQDNIHGNGLVIYEDANNISVDGFLGMNRPRGVSIQTKTIPIADRSNTVRNFVVTQKRTHPDAGPVGAEYPWQGGYGETNSLFEGGIVGGKMLLHPSAGLAASTGMIVRNMVISSLICNELPGIALENCLIFNEAGSGKTSFTGLGATDDGGNVFAPSDSWNGVITIAMQQALTRNVGGVGYTARTLGTTANPWIIPAYGATFVLIDVNVTTVDLKIGHRADDTFASILNTRPGSSIALPAGVTDNDLFGLYKGQIYPAANLAAGSYSLTIRETNNEAENTGATTHDTVVVVTAA